jgi:hypothetical protein
LQPNLSDSSQTVQDARGGTCYVVHAGWPQSQAISDSLDPASLQNWLQYFSPFGGTHKHGTWAHFSAFWVSMFHLILRTWCG